MVRDTLKNGFTDDIWETFTELFTERFEHDLRILDSEKI
jgi:ribosomal protein S17E